MSNNELNEAYPDIAQGAKSSPVAVLLASFLGFCGAHRFYTGYFFIGLFQLLTCGGFLIWFIIDLVALFNNHFEDSKGRPLVNYNSKIATGLVAFAVILSMAWGCLYIRWVQEIAQKAKNINIATPLDNVKKANENDLEEKIDAQGAKLQDSIQKRQDFINRDFKFTTKAGLNILEDDFCTDVRDMKMICGTIVNISNKPAKNIVIKFHLLDKDKKFVAFTEAKIYKLDGMEEWNFKAPIYYKTVESYKVFKIISY